MSSGQLPRDPFFFPHMKHRARKRRPQIDEAVFMRALAMFPDVQEAFREFAHKVAEMEPAFRAIRDEYVRQKAT
ncbi:hypothetical protein ACFYY5_29155 [Nocardia elegans]|uniref:Uncharacterized protein n=1 Tax=Nocardia elegans TaxID=300029 RepID=A0ABW6TLC0_9NOCA